MKGEEKQKGKGRERETDRYIEKNKGRLSTKKDFSLESRKNSKIP